MGKKSTPKPPDLTPLSNAQLQISQQQLAQAQEQMQISKDQFAKYMDLSQQELAQSQAQYDKQVALQQKALEQADAANATSKSVADAQIESMKQSQQYAQEDRDRYTNTILPLQDQYIAEARAYNTPEKQAAAAGQALADNQTQLEAQRNNQMAQLSSMGIDPSQVMSSSLSSQLGVAGAAQGALGANAARQNVIQTGYGMLANAINMGNNLPAQVTNSTNAATNAANSAAGNINSSVANYNSASGIGQTASGIRQSSLGLTAQLTGSPMSWASLGNQSYGGASNGIMNASSIINQGYQNQMQAQQMKNDQAASTMNAIGSVASIAGMAMMAEGGSVDDAQRQSMDWGDMSSAMPLRVSDISFDPSSAQQTARSQLDDYESARAMKGWGTGLAMAGQLMSTPPVDNSAKYRKDFLAPVYRAEGGAMDQSRVMPSMQARDKIHAMLSPGEYVIPADVVRHLGIQHFDKLVNKFHRPGA